jgi:predicted site-specific integrase-resolvase
MRDERLLTESQAADRLSVSSSTLRRWRREGGGPGYHRLPSGAIRYSSADIETYISLTAVPGPRTDERGSSR